MRPLLKACHIYYYYYQSRSQATMLQQARSLGRLALPLGCPLSYCRASSAIRRTRAAATHTRACSTGVTGNTGLQWELLIN